MKKSEIRINPPLIYTNTNVIRERIVRKIIDALNTDNFILIYI